MKFNFSKEKFNEVNSKKLSYYKISIIILIISITLLILTSLLNSNNVIVNILGLFGGIGIINSIIAFISYCSFSKQRNRVGKLFIQNNELHYHQSFETGYTDMDNGGSRVKESKQYVVKKVFNYDITKEQIIINGEIEYTKNGLNNKPKIINSISIPNYFSQQEKLYDFLDKSKFQ